MKEVTNNLEPLAHSARGGAPQQTYFSHVGNVCKYAAVFARDAGRYSEKWCPHFLDTVERAAAYHDLGKLDGLFQEVLRLNCENRHKFNHVEAGTAYLLRVKQFEAAITCCSHHVGLPSVPAEKAKVANGLNLALRDTGQLVGLGNSGWQRTEALLDSYLAQHHSLFSAVAPTANKNFSGLVRRLALSCLVDADHSDTAQHYRKERDLRGLPLRAAERLDRLEKYVAELGNPAAQLTEKEQARLAIRREVFKACHDRVLDPQERIVACDSPVGTGKTTAIMAHLLKVARERGLRRIFVVLPYTNIIDQSVRVYRNSLVLDDEIPEEIVAANHHRVEFSGEDWRDLRQLSQRWEAPIVITTAVQFFETLAAKETTVLRKIHQVPGSAIFVDEAHAAMPAPLWPQMWRWLRELCDDWGCHLVLASGSLARFWELVDFVPEKERAVVGELVPEMLRDRAKAAEGSRVSVARRPAPLSRAELSEFVSSKPGPRLVIFNTIQSAAVFASHLSANCHLPSRVEHLSTSLSPRDRARTILRVTRRLGDPGDTDWSLVATSCVEAGVDFSFRTAFRESCGLVNLIQISGRVNRSSEFNGAEVWDFQHDADDCFTTHPRFSISRRVLEQMFQEGIADAQHCTESLRRELNFGTGEAEALAKEIRSSEDAADYPKVAELCRLITADTQTVIVDQELAAKFETGNTINFPTAQEIAMGSVEIWRSRLSDLAPKSLGPGGELLALSPDQYDEFLGYMRGIIPLLNIKSAGGIVI
jgi:CRISPR-associated endonuclease/helicase Cas3